jgi:hypothetical protein
MGTEAHANANVMTIRQRIEGPALNRATYPLAAQKARHRSRKTPQHRLDVAI